MSSARLHCIPQEVRKQPLLEEEEDRVPWSKFPKRSGTTDLLIRKRTGCHEVTSGIATLTTLHVHGVKDVDALSCSSKVLLLAKPASYATLCKNIHKGVTLLYMKPSAGTGLG